MIGQQMSLFEELFERKTTTKKIKLLEMFSGIGAQAKALEVISEYAKKKGINVEFEHYKTCEWQFDSIIAYNLIHTKDFTDYAKDMTK